ncbi:MAG: primase TraC [Pseudomonadota bacterium]
MAKDLNDVIQQMAAQGVNLPAREDLGRAFSRILRFRSDGDRGAKKRAWVRLFEYRAQSGTTYISGVFGHKGEQWKVEAAASDWTPADRARWLEHKREAEAAAARERQADVESAAEKAAKMWQRAAELGPQDAPHPYLERKQVGAFGLRRGFNNRCLVPLRDVRGQLRGLQYISAEGEKLFGTGTGVDGHSHLLGELREGVPLLAFGEGYATCATVHMATGWPVVTCFHAGNLLPVMLEWRKLYPELPFVVVADDDRHLRRRLSERLARLGIAMAEDDLVAPFDHEWRIPDGPRVTLKAGWKNDANGVMRLEGEISVNGKASPLLLENAGQAKAHAAARRCKARVFTPFFADRTAPHTDWNDLHCSAGLASVREQLLAALEAPPEKPAAKARAQRGEEGGARRATRGGGGAGRDDGNWGDEDGEMPFLERFTLIYGTTTVWDALHRKIIRLESMKAAFGKQVDRWLTHGERRLVTEDHVVFDPSARCQPPQWVNLFDRLPLEPDPDASKCQLIVRHVHNLCQEDEQLMHWVLAWLAYPLQHPGAKMRTALVLHGRTEGTGKSMLGQIMRRLYGRYATSVGQAELQRDFNDWLSAKLLVVCEEVVSRQDRAHHQGMLQALITQPTVQINTKNMPIREEANLAQFIFFSNQQTPLILNPRDRRYTVIRVEQEHPPEYFQALQAELDNGGAEAFLGYLQAYPLDGFNEFTRPFENRDRLHLITLGMAVDQRFFAYWSGGLAGVPFCCCPAADLYTAFKAWARVHGERFVPNQTMFGRTMTEELERLGAPPKRTVRYLAYSDKAVSEGDFSGETTARQGVMYFIPAAHELLRPPVAGEERKPPEDPPPDVTRSEYFNAKVKMFQPQLHDLLASARRFM